MYVVEIKKKTKKELETLSQKEQKRIFAAFEVLRRHPFSGKKLHGEYEGS